ncbi:hypothetical protein JTE90_003488 [Oedothorax gibbosus]|uniref:Uncharacterized protein n=1 Tax=Oedothorax gibbosus TaxID=931172 RepID=A0AAV6UFE9_9ARAC|nr:hypothetical protein JTE90_003488 [Oedothorax gibbosus]
MSHRPLSSCDRACDTFVSGKRILSAQVVFESSTISDAVGNESFVDESLSNEDEITGAVTNEDEITGAVTNEDEITEAVTNEDEITEAVAATSSSRKRAKKQKKPSDF